MSSGASRKTWRDDKRLLYALLAVVVALLINAMVAAAPECQPIQSAEQAHHNQDGQSVPNWISVAYAPLCATGSFVTFHKTVFDGLSTLIIAAFTLVLAWSTGGLWAETARLAREAESQRKDTLESIKIARDAYVAEHRTWVQASCMSIEQVQILKGTIHTSIAIEAKNVGTLPAIDVHLSCKSFHSRGYIVPKATLQEAINSEKILQSSISSTGVVLMPGDPYRVTFNAATNIDARMEATAQAQMAQGVVARHLALSAIFFTIYKSLTSNDWRYTGHVVVFRKKDGTFWDVSKDQIVTGDDIKFTVLPSYSDMA